MDKQTIARVLKPLHHNGKYFNPGDLLNDLGAEQADQLQNVGVVEIVSSDIKTTVSAEVDRDMHDLALTVDLLHDLIHSLREENEALKKELEAFKSAETKVKLEEQSLQTESTDNNAAASLTEAKPEHEGLPVELATEPEATDTVSDKKKSKK